MGGLPAKGSSSLADLESHQNKRSVVAESGPALEPKKRICCACPGTKKLRDECIVEHGEAACTKWIEAHCQCLRAEGFNI